MTPVSAKLALGDLANTLNALQSDMVREWLPELAKTFFRYYDKNVSEGLSSRR